MKRILKEPLLHFLLIGGAIFAVAAWRRRTNESPDRATARIELNAAAIDRLRSSYQQQFGQPPNEQQLRGLVTANIREEVLYREALAIGLDRDDTIVRRRMAQKMEFLTGDLADLEEPKEASLHAFFERNAARYARPAQVSFRHLYFSKAKRGTKCEADAREALAALATGVSDEAMGDAFLHGFEFAARDAQEITAMFGEEFAAQLATLREGEWRGPVASSYGLHLVRVDARGPVQPARFDAVRETVVRDFNEERRNTANRDIFEKLRERYQVAVDEAALLKAAGPGMQLVQR